MSFKHILPRRLTGNSRFWLVQTVYLLTSSLFLLAFRYLPANQDWLMHTIQRFYEQWRTVGRQHDVAFRQREGYGNAYVYTTLIRQHCQPTDYFLIPPQQYLIRNAHRQGLTDGYAWLYPSVLYYHLGQSVHVVDMTNADSLINRATYTFWGEHNRLFLRRLTDQNRAVVMANFRQYDPHFFAYTPEQAQAYYKSHP